MSKPIENLHQPQISFDNEFQSLVEKQERWTRIKERMIEDAVMLVLRWRQLSDKSSGDKVTLKQGAEIIGVAKKSLDDYLLQLRLGWKYGFDYKKHGSSKIGILRTFNRKMKKKFKEGKFLAGRKRKEEEEDYSEMVRKIILEIHGSSYIIPDLEQIPKNDDKIRDLLVTPIKEDFEEGAQDRIKYGIRPVKKISSTTFNTRNSEKDSEIGNCSEECGPVNFSFQNNWNAECSEKQTNLQVFMEDDFCLPEFEGPLDQPCFFDIWNFTDRIMQ